MSSSSDRPQEPTRTRAPYATSGNEPTLLGIPAFSANCSPNRRAAEAATPGVPQISGRLSASATAKSFEGFSPASPWVHTRWRGRPGRQRPGQHGIVAIHHTEGLGPEQDQRCGETPAGHGHAPARSPLPRSSTWPRAPRRGPPACPSVGQMPTTWAPRRPALRLWRASPPEFPEAEMATTRSSEPTQPGSRGPLTKTTGTH